jgi:ceramide glucosyltransferase
VLGDRPVCQPIGRIRFIEVWRRHRRWLSCRRKYIPATYACEALFCAPIACLAGAAAFGALALPPAAGAAATAAIWCAIDCLFILANRWHFGPLTPLAWLVRELIFLPLWTAALFARTVNWYGRRVPVVG